MANYPATPASGTHTLTIQGKGNYAASATASVTVTFAAVNGPWIGPSSRPYTGVSHAPDILSAITWTENSSGTHIPFEQGNDYDCEFSETPLDAGTYTVTLRAKSTKCKELTDNAVRIFTYTIEPVPLKLDITPASKVYGRPDPVFSTASTSPNNFQAGDISYWNITREPLGEDVGVYTIRVEPKADPVSRAKRQNYTTVEVTNAGGKFSIEQAELPLFNPNPIYVPVSYNRQQFLDAITAYDLLDGTELTSPKDFTISGYPATPSVSGTAVGVKFYGAGNYKSSSPNPQEIDVYFIGVDGPKLEYNSAVYNGEAQPPKVIWKKNIGGNLTDFVPNSDYTMVIIDSNGTAASSPKNAGQYYVVLTPVSPACKQSVSNLSQVVLQYEITKRRLTLAITKAEKTYGDRPDGFEYTLTPVPAVDQAEVRVEFTREAGENAGQYSYSYALAGSAAANYFIGTLSGTPPAKFTISPAPLPAFIPATLYLPATATEAQFLQAITIPNDLVSLWKTPLNVELARDIDFTMTGYPPNPAAVASGTATVVFQGKGNYTTTSTQSISVVFETTIGPKLSVNKTIYNGADQPPAVIWGVVQGTAQIGFTKGADYTVQIKDLAGNVVPGDNAPKDAGLYQVVLTPVSDRCKRSVGNVSEVTLRYYEITKLEVGVTAPASKLFGDPDTILVGCPIVTLASADNNKVKAIITRMPPGSADPFDPVGNYTLKIELADVDPLDPRAKNYELKNPTDPFEIKARPYAVTALMGSTKVYGDEDPEFVKVVGLSAVGGADGVYVKVERATAYATSKDVGTYTGALIPAGAPGPLTAYLRNSGGGYDATDAYALTTVADANAGIGTLIITKRPVRLTPNSATKYFGQDDDQAVTVPVPQNPFDRVPTNIAPITARVTNPDGSVLPNSLWTDDLMVQIERDPGETPAAYTLRVKVPPLSSSFLTGADAGNYDPQAGSPATLQINPYNPDAVAEIGNSPNGVRKISGEASDWFIDGVQAQVVPPDRFLIAAASESAWTNSQYLFDYASALFSLSTLTVKDDSVYHVNNNGVYMAAQPPAPIAKAGQIAIPYFLRNSNPTDPAYKAITVRKTAPAFSQDTGLVGDVTISDPNTRQINITSTSPEPLYLHGDILMNGPGGADMLEWRNSAALLPAGASKPLAVKDGSLASTPTNFSSAHTSTKTAYNAVYPASGMLEITGRDYAGNEKDLSKPFPSLATVPLYTPNPLTAKSPDMPYSSHGYAMPKGGGSFALTGEPLEVVKVVHFNGSSTYTYYIQLDGGGSATIKVGRGGVASSLTANVIGGVSEPINGVVWDTGERTHHPLQHITFSYADDAHLKDIYATTIDFTYNGFALPITVDPQFKDRDFTIPITLPEDGAVTRIKAGDQVLYDSSAVSGTWFAQAEGVTQKHDLTWMNPRVKLPVPGVDKLSISYMSLTGEVYTGIFDIAKSEVRTPIRMYISPVRHQGKFIHAEDRYLRIYGTATEYEPLAIGVDGFSKDIPVVWTSGNGAYDIGGTDKGEWSVVIPLYLLPRNKPLEIRVSYRDVYGQGSLVKEVIQVIGGDSRPVIITTADYEGMKYVAGIAQPGAKVTIYVNDPDGRRIPVRVTADVAGYFVAALPENYVGGAMTLIVENPDGTREQVTLNLWEEPQAIKAYPVGKLFSHYFEDGVADWLQATPVTAADLAEGITLPLMAGNTFEVGSVTVRLENGKAVYDYVLNDERITVEQVYFTLEPGGLDDERLGQILRRAPGSPGQTEVTGTGIYWLCLELWVVLPPERMLSTPQILSGSESPVHAQYLGYQQ